MIQPADGARLDPGVRDFRMGCDDVQERPPTDPPASARVRISRRRFFRGKAEVTQELWLAVVAARTPRKQSDCDRSRTRWSR